MVLRKVVRKLREKQLERHLRNYQRTKKYVVPLLGEKKEVVRKIAHEHGEWIEKTLEHLDSSEREDNYTEKGGSPQGPQGNDW